MKESFRQSMAWLHTWSGLVVGWILFAVFATGTLSYFRPEISLWMRPELRDVREVPGAVSSAIRMLQLRAGNATRWFIVPPNEREPALRVSWSLPSPEGGRSSFASVLLDPATGEELHVRETRGGDFFYLFHFELNMKPSWGRWVVGFCAMFMFAALISGVITHKKIFKDFFTFRPRKGQRSWLDAHNALGVLALPYHVMITYTGLITLMFLYMPWGVQANYGANKEAFFAEALHIAPETAAAHRPGKLTALEPLLLEAQRRWNGAAVADITIRNPTDVNSRIQLRRDSHGRVSHDSQAIVFDGVTGALISTAGEEPAAAQTRGVLFGLHMANFSSTTLRWLFVLCGFTGILMVASGLVLWSVKRAPERVKAGHTPFGHRLVEVLNIGVITGLPIGIAVYFWVNRLLPAELAGRAVWEVRAFFIAWILSFIVPIIRPARIAWPGQFTAGTCLFALLPVVNALTTQTHLGVALPRGNWVYAGFDLTMFGIAGVLALTAWYAARAASHRQKTRKKALISTVVPAAAERA